VSALAQFLGTWDVAPVPTLAVVAAGGVYLWATRQVPFRHPGRVWPRLRTASFLTGLGSVFLVVSGPIGAFDDTFFWAHMVQHLVLMMVAAPLLLLGAPVLLALQVASRDTRHRFLVPLLRSRCVRMLTKPTVSWLLFAATLLGTHFTGFYEYALTHPLVHDAVEHPLYLGVALAYFYPIIGSNPVPHGPAPLVKVASLVLQMGVEAVTGFFIYTARGVLYPFYATTQRPFGPGPLFDQQIGGGLMWCTGMLVDSLWIVVAVQGWMRSETLAGNRISRRIAAEQARATG
jgi:cytochrome c oxidase assembly factor CtaG